MMSPMRARGWFIPAASLLMVGITFMGCPPNYRVMTAEISIQLDPAFLVDLGPAFGLVAEVFLEFLRRIRHRQDAGLLEPVGHGRVGHGAHHVGVDLLHHGARRT